MSWWKPVSPERKAPAVAAYIEGMPVRVILQRYPMCMTTLYCALNEAGVPLRDVNHRQRRPYTMAELHAAKRIIATPDGTVVKAAHLLGRPVKQLRKLLRIQGVAPDLSKAARIAVAARRQPLWTAEQDWTLRTLCAVGLPYRLIGAAVGKAETAAAKRASLQRLMRPAQHHMTRSQIAALDIPLIIAVAKLHESGHRVSEIGGGLWELDRAETLTAEQLVKRVEWMDRHEQQPQRRAA